MKYKKYLETVEHLTLEEMDDIYSDILNQSVQNNEDFQFFWKELVDNAISYTTVRSNWSIHNPKTTDRRSEKHNAVINSFLALERVFNLNHWDSSFWTEKLFLSKSNPQQRLLEDVTMHRKRIGDFANYIVFMQALETRDQ